MSFFKKNLFNLSLLFLILLNFLSFLVVILRYFFGLGWVSLQESLLYLHSFVFLFSCLKACEKDKHVRVDMLYEKLTLPKKKALNKLGFFFLALPMCLVLLFTSYPYALNSIKWLEGSSDAGGLNFVFVLKSFLPLFSILLLAQTFEMSFLKRSKEH